VQILPDQRGAAEKLGIKWKIKKLNTVDNSIQMPMDAKSIDRPRHLLNHSIPKSNYSGLIGELSPGPISSYSGLKNCSLENSFFPEISCEPGSVDRNGGNIAGMLNPA
jgi:hypothetical protein